MYRRLLTVRAGRRVDVVDSGESHGVPVLRFHGTPMGPLEGVGDGDELGVRAVCVGRPGYGDTSRAEPLLAVAVQDARETMVQLGIDRYAVLGVSGGGPFAAALADTAGDEVVALGLVAGAAGYDAEQPTDDDDELEARRLVDMARAGRVDEAAARLLTAVAADIDALADADALPSPILDVMRDGSKNGWDGYVYDRLAVGLADTVHLEGIRCPTYLCYGGADTSVPPSHGRWYAARIPRADLVVLPGADHVGGITAGLPQVLRRLVEEFSA